MNRYTHINTCTHTNNAAPSVISSITTALCTWLLAEAGLGVNNNNNQFYNKVSLFPSFALSADKDDKCGSAALSLLCSHYSLISMTYSWQQKERGSAESKQSVGALHFCSAAFLGTAG